MNEQAFENSNKAEQVAEEPKKKEPVFLGHDEDGLAVYELPFQF